MGSETDYRDALPRNMSAVAKQLFGATGYLIQEPGLTLHATGEGIVRGAIWNERLKLHFMVSGEKLIAIDSNGGVRDLGIITGTDTVSLPYSFNTQAIIADGKYYLYDPSNGLRHITDDNVGTPIDCDWIDNYYFFTDGEFLFHTKITSEEEFDPLDFATSEYSPDPTLGVKKTPDDKMAVFDRYTTLYFDNDASENFSFRFIKSRTVKVGIVGTHCKAEMQGAIYLLGGAKEEAVSVHVLGVGSAQKVATREIDKIIGQYSESELVDSVLEARVEDGYHYLIVHLPNETLKFNATIAAQVGLQNAWSILSGGTLEVENYRAKHGVFQPELGKWVYGDKISSNIGILDETVGTQYGEIAEWELFTPYNYIETASIDELEIETVPGFTSIDDATVFVSLTYDGVTYGREMVMQYGKKANYSQRFIRYRLGYVNDWFAFKLRAGTRSRMAFSRGFINYG